MQTRLFSPKLNRSQAIRDYSQAHPDAKPKAIAEALKSKGIKISAQYVSTILSSNRNRRSKKRGRKAAANGSALIEELLLVKDFVRKVGLERAKDVLASYARLVDRAQLGAAAGSGEPPHFSRDARVSLPSQSAQSSYRPESRSYSEK